MPDQRKIFLYGFLAFHLLWFGLDLGIHSDVFAGPLPVYQTLAALLGKMQIWEHMGASFLRVLEGLFISLALGVPTGILLANNPRLNKVGGALLYFTYPIPKLALLPVVMLLFGIGEAAKIIMIVLILVFQITLAARDAVSNIAKDDFAVMTSLGASRLQVLRWVTFPAALPEILTSLRVATGTVISVLFFTETYGTEYGMGFYIVDAWMRLAYNEMYAGIYILSLMGFLLFFAIDRAEARLCGWKRQ